MINTSIAGIIYLRPSSSYYRWNGYGLFYSMDDYCKEKFGIEYIYKDIDSLRPLQTCLLITENQVKEKYFSYGDYYRTWRIREYSR